MDSGTLLGQIGAVPGPRRPPLAAGQKVVVLAQNDAAEKGNLAAYQNGNAAWNRHDAKAFSAGLAPDVVWSTLANPSDTQGDTAVVARLQGLWTGFSDARLELSSSWAAGDYVVGVGSFRGTNDGDMVGMPKSGRTVDVPFLEVVRYAKGKIQNEWFFFDSFAFAPPPK
jgi:steroid delta-isomerase-like uncharacterized protein